MLLEFILGGATLYTGAKVYNRQNAKARLVQKLSGPTDRDGPLIRHQLLTPVQIFVDQRIRPLFDSSWNDQLQEFSAANQAAMSTNRVVAEGYDYEMVVYGAALGFATLGLFNPVFNIISLPAVIYGMIWDIKDATVKLLKERKATIDTLIMFTMVTGLLIGTGSVFVGSSLIFFLISLNIFLITWSRRLIGKIRRTTQANLVDVFSQQPDFAWVYKEGIEIRTSLETLVAGDTIVVHAGEVIPVDGKIVDGLASIDQRMLTGEAQPVEKGAGETVFALTILISGRIQICVEKTGEETTAAQIGQILNQTINFKTDMQLWSEDIADKSVLPTMAAFTALLPVIGAQGAYAILVAHPKMRTTVATYLGVLSYFNLASQDGILIKDGLVLELLNQVDTVVFDKTGTLTDEQPHVGQIVAANGYTEDEILTYAAAAEYRQTHPIALAITAAATSRGLEIPQIDDAAYKIGYGLTVMVGEDIIRLGSTRFIQGEQLIIPPEMADAQQLCHEQGHSLVLVAVNEAVAGAIVLQPSIRPEAQTIIRNLRHLGIQSMYIISGDHETPTRRLANELGIDHYFAETLPENKADLIEELQTAGKIVCYVGDGINDSIALKKAAVSVSLRGASTVATDTAQVILMDGNLTKLCTLFELADKFESNMKQTFTCVLIPHLVALSGIFLFHFGLAPAVILSQLGLAAGIGNALRPRLQK